MTLRDIDCIIDAAQTRNFNRTLTNAAADRSICLAPRLLNDHDPRYARTPFDRKETVSRVLCTYRENNREISVKLVELRQKKYKHILRQLRTSFARQCLKL